MSVVRGDCVEVMAGMEPDSVDAVCCDPPYGIRFMGAAWDGADIERDAKADRTKRTYLGPPAGPQHPQSGARTVSAFGNGAAQAGSYERDGAKGMDDAFRNRVG